MRNHELTFTCVDLRNKLEDLHRVLQAVAASPAKIKIVVDAASRGDRLAACGQFRSDQILQMFTNMLGSAHGAANSVFAADVARLRKTSGGNTAAYGLLGGTVAPPALPA